MRTSRVSRDTAKVVDALSTTRRTRSSTLNNTTPPARSRKRKHDPDADVSSPLSSPPRSASPPATKIKPEPDSKPKPARRQPAKRVRGSDGGFRIEPPTNWERVYELTREMRAKVLAPVDTMGCERLYDEKAAPEDRRFQTLVSLMLSSQTKDTVTAGAMARLKTELPGGLTIASILEVDPITLDGLIGKVGFHNTKTKHIQLTAAILRDRFSGDIPDTIEGLVSLPGVGPKMAYLTMSAAWGRDEGIGVDVHVHRITNLWGWQKTQTPEQTRAALESWLPRDRWHEINHLLVGFGQMICLPIGRRCGQCRLAEEKLCPSRVATAPAKARVKKEAVVKEEPEIENEVKGVGPRIKDETGNRVKLEEVDQNAMAAVPVAVQDIEDVGGRTVRRESSQSV